MGAYSSPEHAQSLIQLGRAVKQAGWAGEEAIKALAIALAESGGIAKIVSADGKYRGAWQLTKDHPVNPFDLEAATQYVKQFVDRHGWAPTWGAARGAYRKAIPLAREIMELV